MEDKYEKISKLARRRGFFWLAYEIYGGVGGFITLGPLGVWLKNNIIEKWRRIFILPHQDFIVEIESPIVAPARVFEASGHVEHFTDYIVECLKCHRKYRADHLIEEHTGLSNLEKYSAEELTDLIRKYSIKCPECGGELGQVKLFNLLFKTTIGPYSENIGYARPETAQGMFVDFHRVYQVMRKKMPIGIAQIGRVLRNEISPRQGPIRLREFTIMELELFYDPKNPECPLLEKVEDEKINLLTEEDVAQGRDKPRTVTIREAVEEKMIISPWNAYFMALAKRFVSELGIPDECQMFVAKLPEERAHYALQTFDQVVKVERWGWVEVSGHAYRTDYDLKRHMEYSKRDLTAERILEKPIIVKKTSAQIIPAKVLSSFGKEKGVKILKELAKIDKDNITRKLVEEGAVKLTIDNETVTLDKSFFKINVKEEKIEVEKFIPHVAEPSFGVERLLYVTLEYAYTEKEGRVVLRLPRDIAPIKAAVFPIVKKEPLTTIAREIYEELRASNFTVIYDDDGSIGRRYARVDEIGVPFAITVDGQTTEDNTVTIRDRDTWKQIRIPRTRIIDFLSVALRHPRASLEELEKLLAPTK